MDFEFSDSQELLRGSVRRFVEDRAPLTYVREQMASDAPTSREVWQGLADLGAVGLLVPQAHGGAGMGMVDAAVVLEELGRMVHPGPYLASAVTATSLVTALGTDADRAALLPGMADGSIVATVALLEPGQRYAWSAPATVAHALADGTWALRGMKVHVDSILDATVVFVVARVDPAAGRGDGELGVFAISTDAAGVACTTTETIDATRREGTLSLTDAVACRVGDGDATAALTEALDRAAVALVIDGVGAASRALELSVDYAKQRVAFGQPIGSFQAVQHLCADMLRAVELGRAGGYYACWAMDAATRTEAHRAATLAKAYASDAFAQLGGSAIQVFGGVGFTWEHDIHIFYKRLLSCAYRLGTADDHLDELAAIVIG